jgi:RNA polymerase sigma factor (sigma-70 family)
MVNAIVQDHMGWATSIAKSVARAWNMDWQLDGLDGGAFEALLFCAKRYEPARGVPFRGYARRRIHESCTEEARKSKAWQRGTGVDSQIDQDAREISAKLLDLFPELREGYLPAAEESEDLTVSVRSSLRQLLAGASLIAAFQDSSTENPEVAVEYKRLIEILADLEPVHQHIIWSIYYKGLSLRGLAEEWETDDLSVIREHKEILAYLCSRMEKHRGKIIGRMKIRRGLRTVAQRIKKEKDAGPFSQFFLAVALFCLALLSSIFRQTLF